MRITVNQVKQMKQKGEKITMLTAYDYSTARIIDEVGIPLILVGDSLGMVVLGYESTIPVMGHIGLTPQSIHQLGGYKVQGKTPEEAARLLEDARVLEQAGAFAIVLETVPAPLAALITKSISIPTIGIGAGIDCDGQVQVINDILGSFTDFVPKHAKQYAKLADIIRAAITEYDREVKAGSFSMDESILARLK